MHTCLRALAMFDQTFVVTNLERWNLLKLLEKENENAHNPIFLNFLSESLKFEKQFSKQHFRVCLKALSWPRYAVSHIGWSLSARIQTQKISTPPKRHVAYRYRLRFLLTAGDRNGPHENEDPDIRFHDKMYIATHFCCAGQGNERDFLKTRLLPKLSGKSTDLWIDWEAMNSINHHAIDIVQATWKKKTVGALGRHGKMACPIVPHSTHAMCMDFGENEDSKNVMLFQNSGFGKAKIEIPEMWCFLKGHHHISWHNLTLKSCHWLSRWMWHGGRAGLMLHQNKKKQTNDK